jgi:hypothetical protein
MRKANCAACVSGITPNLNPAPHVYLGYMSVSDG